MDNSIKKVPPDGGYGWVITLAYGLNNVSIYLCVLFFIYQTKNAIIYI